VADPEPLALGDPVDPVQAEVASAASTVTVLHNTAASLAGIRMKPPDYPDYPADDRLFPCPGLNKPAFAEQTAWLA
jgi:hypothetical protein